MKKLFLLIGIILLLNSCVVMPTRLMINERRLWIHQNYPKKYYYKTHPVIRGKVKQGKTYTPYFRPGKY